MRKLIQGASFGILWMASVGHWYVTWQLPGNNIHQDSIVAGSVLDVDCGVDYQRLTIAVTKLGDAHYVLPRRIRIYEHEPAVCRLEGQHVNLTARLKPAFSLANPGAPDFQRTLVSQSIVASGYVKAWHNWSEPEASRREHIKRFIREQSQPDPRWLLALLIGDRSGLSESDWETLQKTGTAHLFSVSGLHVGIIATALVLTAKLMVMLCIRGTGTLAPYHNLRRQIAVAVCITAAGYVSLTGAALPAVRAWVLLVICFYLATSHVVWTSRHIAIAMTVACLLLFPLQLLSAGFMLSLGAVYGIWFLLWRYRPGRLRWWQAGLLMQAGLSLLLLPLTAGWFSLISWSSLPVNLVLIPLITVSLPVMFLALSVAALLPEHAPSIISQCAAFLNTAALLLEHLAAQRWGTTHFSVPPGALFMLLVGMVLCTVPGIPYKRRCLVLCLLPVMVSWLPFRGNSWYLHVFDVGQGTAMAVTRGDRAIVLDTGPAYKGQAYAMENAVLPALHRLNIRHVDGVIVSHSDNDHAGGEDALRQHAFTNRSTFWHSPLSGCQQGRVFAWQGLTFRYFWPEKNNQTDNNANSCVLTVSGNGHTLLFPGDIERTTEYRLLVQGTSLKADVLIAPHHGSQTSSTMAWVRATRPHTVIYTTGYLNRWQFPSSVVASRYRHAGAMQIETAASGYVRVTFASSSPLQVLKYRQDIAPAWYHAAVLADDTDNRD